jgi:Cu/Ag efflux protein CusF
MKSRLSALLVPLMVVALALPALAKTETGKPGREASQTIQWTGTVTAVDTANRTVTIQGPQGNIRTVKCGSEVKNFDQIKAGHKVHVEYTEAMVVSVRKSTEPSTVGESASMETAPKGAMPSMEAERTQQMTATVEKIDHKTRMVTLKGQEGNMVTFRVSDEFKNLKDVKKGDEVVAQYTEALAIKVTEGTEKAKK